MDDTYYTGIHACRSSNPLQPSYSKPRDARKEAYAFSMNRRFTQAQRPATTSTTPSPARHPGQGRGTRPEGSRAPSAQPIPPRHLARLLGAGQHDGRQRDTMNMRKVLSAGPSRPTSNPSSTASGSTPIAGSTSCSAAMDFAAPASVPPSAGPPRPSDAGSNGSPTRSGFTIRLSAAIVW